MQFSDELRENIKVNMLQQKEVYEEEKIGLVSRLTRQQINTI